MKKIDMLSIRDKKIIGEEELVLIKGGYDPANPTPNCCLCLAPGSSSGFYPPATNSSECQSMCNAGAASGIWQC